MGRWSELIRAPGRRPLWLDDTKYTAALLANGNAPWSHVAQWANWRRTALKLLDPDVAVLDVSAATAAWSDQHPDTLAQESDPGGRLRMLWSDPGLQAHLRELLQALRAVTNKPLALSMHSPRRLLAAPSDSDEDALEDAAADMSQLMRALSDGGVDVVLIREDSAPVSQALNWLSCYGSLINVARHYRWDVGVELPGGAPGGSPGVDFFVAPGDAAGHSLPPSFWRGGPPPAMQQTGFLFGEIAADADPRQVLAQVGKLR